MAVPKLTSRLLARPLPSVRLLRGTCVNSTFRSLTSVTHIRLAMSPLLQLQLYLTLQLESMQRTVSAHCQESTTHSSWTTFRGSHLSRNRARVGPSVAAAKKVTGRLACLSYARGNHAALRNLHCARTLQKAPSQKLQTPACSRLASQKRNVRWN